MSNLAEVVDQVVEELENLDQAREKVIQLTRKLNRASGRGISKLIREEPYQDYLATSRGLVLEIEEFMEIIAPITSWSTTNSGTEEYCEFEILHALTNGKPLPHPKNLHTPSWIWINGLGDAIGELRRYMLSKLMQNEMDEAKTILELIQDIYDTIVGLEFSKSMVSNLRRKIDVARTLVDKCESDFTNAVIHKQTKTSKS